jgi:hypothetical protein
VATSACGWVPGPALVGSMSPSPKSLPHPLTTSSVHIHANELQIPLVWAPAALFVGHMSATWAIAEGEAVAHQGHLWTWAEATQIGS